MVPGQDTLPYVWECGRCPKVKKTNLATFVLSNELAGYLDWGEVLDFVPQFLDLLSVWHRVFLGEFGRQRGAWVIFPVGLRAISHNNLSWLPRGNKVFSLLFFLFFLPVGFIQLYFNATHGLVCQGIVFL